MTNIESQKKRILHLTLHRKWFDKIASGEKTTEYREAKSYWLNRIAGREFDEIHFTNGYGKARPFMRIIFKYCVIEGNEIKIALGEILEIRNYERNIQKTTT